MNQTVRVEEEQWEETNTNTRVIELDRTPRMDRFIDIISLYTRIHLLILYITPRRLDLMSTAPDRDFYSLYLVDYESLWTRGLSSQKMHQGEEKNTYKSHWTISGTDLDFRFGIFRENY